MPDLNPEIWDNPTLGSAAQNVTLDQLEFQQTEDRRARIEGREPLIAVREVDYPILPESGSVPSNIEAVKLVPAEDVIHDNDDFEKEFPGPIDLSHLDEGDDPTEER